MPRPTPLLLTMLLCLLLAAGPGWARADDPPQDEAAQGLAQVLETDQRLDDALRKLALDAGQGVSFTLAAGKGLRSDTLGKLVDIYRKVLARYPDNSLAAAGLARALAGLGRASQALAAYERALKLDPANKRLAAELEGLKASQAPRLRASVLSGVNREYWPLAHRHIYQVHETTWMMQAEAPVGDHWRLGAGWLQGRLRQESLLYGDDDFDLTRRGVFITAAFQPLPELSLSFRLRRELFGNDNQGSYYQMPRDQELWTGYALLQYQAGPWWVNLSANRERDTWPTLDPVTGRGVLKLEAQELLGLAVGRALAPGWELNLSLFHEQYGSDRPDQLNLNGQVLHRPAWLPQLRLGLGLGHYTEEPETLFNLLAGWQWSPLPGLALDLSAQLERSRKEDSWLGLGQALVSWHPLPWLGLTCLATHGQESQGDRDRWWSMDLGVEFRF